MRAADVGGKFSRRLDVLLIKRNFQTHAKENNERKQHKKTKGAEKKPPQAGGPGSSHAREHPPAAALHRKLVWKLPSGGLCAPPCTAFSVPFRHPGRGGPSAPCGRDAGPKRQAFRAAAGSPCEPATGYCFQIPFHPARGCPQAPSSRPPQARPYERLHPPRSAPAPPPAYSA